MVDTTVRTAGPSEPSSGSTRTPTKPDMLSLAGLASIGAGIIHATAAGAHSEHKETVYAFVGVAVFQIAWGALALLRSGRLLALAGAAGNVAAIVGWAMAKSSGISFVEGLEESESIQFADGLAAGLAAVAVLAAVVQAVGAPRLLRQPRTPLLGVAAVASVFAVLPAMVSTGSHSHAGGGQGAEEAGHAHGDAEAAATGEHAEGPSAVVPPQPYDPALPIDLSGVEGVTPEQQARAENMIAITLARLPQFDDAAYAFEQGYRSIGDSITGHEHFIKWDLINDDKVLDPDFPEALVYEVAEPDRSFSGIDAPPPAGTRKLVSAMFMLAEGSTLETVPDLGGELTQWHAHEDLCFSPDPPGPEGPRVLGVTEVGAPCEPPTVRFTPVPMIHVWITPHPCGPFAALEGTGAGQILEGEERLCDHAHGSGA